MAKLMVLIYMTVGVMAVLFATRPNSSFMQDYYKGKYTAQSTVILCLLTILLWPWMFLAGLRKNN